jgi:hypothetical protein
MSQPKSVPTSLFIFRLLSAITFCSIIGFTIGALYGPMGIIGSLVTGFSGAIFFNVFVESQADYIYWWIRVWLELNKKLQ